LGQEVYARAAVELGMQPDSLQAMMWFGEKAIWTRNNWTTLKGEGGSFEEEAAKNPLSRGFVGASMDRPGAPQTPGNAGPVGDAIWQRLAADDEVRAVRVEQTVGMYMDDIEPSFDIEVVATKNYSWDKLLEETATLAKKYDQDSAFVSRVVTKGSTPTENIRPGLEVYFAKKTDLDGAKALIGTLRDMNVDGFTVIQDIRGGVLGVRYQYIPEFDVMYGGKSVQEVPALIQSQREMLDSLLEDIGGLDNVSSAEVMDYDTVVMTGNNYDNFIGTSKDRPGSGIQKVWPELSVSESVQKALAVPGQEGRSQLPSDNALVGETQ